MGMHEIVRSTVSRENLEKGQNSHRKTVTLFEWMCSTETEGEKKRVQKQPEAKPSLHLRAGTCRCGTNQTGREGDRRRVAQTGAPTDRKARTQTKATIEAVSRRLFQQQFSWLVAHLTRDDEAAGANQRPTAGVCRCVRTFAHARTRAHKNPS